MGGEHRHLSERPVSGPLSISLRGSYRVQSRRAARPSSLRGTLDPRDHALAGAVNAALAAHPLRSPGRSIALRTAQLTEREGMFASCSDVLYKHDLFTADQGSEPLMTNLVDLDKALDRWASIGPSIDAVWVPRTAEQIVGINPEEALRHEYFAHEAGHLIGVDIDTKSTSGHFRPGGELAWPLVFIEEVRADLHALALAAEALPSARAVDVFHYHVATRFGMHRLNSEDAGAPFGLIPYLLYVVLAEIGMITVESVGGATRFAMRANGAADIIAGMRAGGEWVTERLTLPELDARSVLDRALVGANHVRRSLEAVRLVASFEQVKGSIA